MRKLELKDIAAYLPYNLRVDAGYTSGIVYKIEKPKIYPIQIHINGWYTEIHKCKPILHPMSDLTKEITVEGYNEGESFVPLIKIAELCNVGTCGRWSVDGSGVKMRDNGIVSIINSADAEVCSYEVQDFLNQWHFDYRNLIGQGLAIDINTLNK